MYSNVDIMNMVNVITMSLINHKYNLRVGINPSWSIIRPIRHACMSVEASVLGTIPPVEEIQSVKIM